MRLAAALLAVLALVPAAAGAERTLVVGSKDFNESYVLAEVMAQTLEGAGFRIERRFGLGGTLVCYRALAQGSIDVYVEYTGTLSQAILDLPGDPDVPALNARLEADGLVLLSPFGFDNTYALVMRSAPAAERGITRISDLARHRDLAVVVSHEFLERRDGWPGLAAAYGFDWTPTGIDHGLAYRALADGSIDVTDAYSTDGELARYDLAVLADDRRFFPQYLAAPLARRDLPAAARRALDGLAGSLSDGEMRRLNAAVVFAGESFADVARRFLGERGIAAPPPRRAVLASRLARNTLVHLRLTGIALALAVLLGLGLALAVHSRPALSRGVVYVAGLMQTVPSIALLALMIPLFGIGELPAIVALFLYSLLPIVRNAVTALATVDPVLRRVAVAIGLSAGQRLRLVFLPLALPNIVAGIRTAAVISIGTATLAAFIGAGGLGEPIVTGLALADTGLILQGAVPAALLAVATELAFEAVERFLLPRHLRLAAATSG
ncbi:MAG TPA: glycine betaine ABC transporter substrate-binding protein [Thermoanaerobaculia bacterium]|nr:glycine betaine ABC transporter substrate-binding protein [Thermoanaerobaculia bacterium]